MTHSESIFVNCWKCKKRFDIVNAERCYEHLEEGQWTTKCDNCGACICHKVAKMKTIKCKVLNEVGIMRVMPSVRRELSKKTKEADGQ